jgi:hypothetical protein
MATTTVVYPTGCKFDMVCPHTLVLSQSVTDHSGRAGLLPQDPHAPRRRQLDEVRPEVLEGRQAARGRPILRASDARVELAQRLPEGRRGRGDGQGYGRRDELYGWAADLVHR